MVGRIVIVEDTDIMRESLAESLGRAGHDVHAFGKGVEALRHIEQHAVDCVITDIRMPEMDGMEVLEKVRHVDDDIQVVMITAHGTVENAVAAMKKGAFDYILKPFQVDELEVVVERAVSHRNLMHENQLLKAKLDERVDDALLGSGEGFCQVREHIRKVCNNDVTILLQGESGSGKEMVARAIHRSGHRKDRPFLCVNCAALSAGLLESELFGHEKGAFTGAERARKGRFELAQGGTILLDEISEIDLSLQAKLLRVLQEKTYERVGSSCSRVADVRVIATTNRDLEQAVRAGDFRQDLFFRLSIYPIQMPPLRERLEDIEELSAHFLKKHAGRLGKPPVTLTRDALKALKSYAWPGNVRELENVLIRALICTSHATLSAGDFSLRRAAPMDAAGGGPAPDGGTLAELERWYIQRTLDRFEGHQTKTAHALDISVRTLRNKIKDWGLAVRKDR